MRQKGSDDLNDSEIIDLFYMRSEQAIIELSVKYGNVCNKVAKNILNNILDAEECVNDAYLGAWNTIPPQNPNPLLTYICRIVRNLSIKKYHANTSVKRYEILKTIFILHIAILEKQCYNSYIPKKEAVSMKDKELRKLIGSRNIILQKRVYSGLSVSIDNNKNEGCRKVAPIF